jgi:hypothetical protein
MPLYYESKLVHPLGNAPSLGPDLGQRVYKALSRTYARVRILIFTSVVHAMRVVPLGGSYLPPLAAASFRISLK